MGLDLCVRALSVWVSGIAEKGDLVLWMRGEKVGAPDKVALPKLSFKNQKIQFLFCCQIHR